MATVEESGVDRWMIGGGAEHTPESARRLVYTSTGGSEGIGAPSDLMVRPLAIPGQGVRIAIGSCLILSRFVGGETQTYQVAVFREQTLEIAPNTTNKDRYDLIVIRVEDGFAAGSTWPKPPEAERADEQYIYPRVIPGVSAAVTTLQAVTGQKDTTGYALARVKVPAATGTITAAQITDLRELAQPKRREFVFARPRIGPDDGPQQYLSALWADGGEFFPGGGGVPNQFAIDVPTWATHFVIDARWMTVYAGKANPHGRFWVEYGDEWRPRTWPGKQDYEFATQHFGFNYPATTDEKTDNWLLMDEWTVPAKLRGKRVTFVFKAGLDKSFGPNPAWMKWNGGLGMRITVGQVSAGARVV